MTLFTASSSTVLEAVHRLEKACDAVRWDIPSRAPRGGSPLRKEPLELQDLQALRWMDESQPTLDSTTLLPCYLCVVQDGDSGSEAHEVGSASTNP